jgi:membrane protease YdiL (CAAX protease family)
MSMHPPAYNDTLQKGAPGAADSLETTAAPTGDTGVTGQYTLPQILGIWAAAALPMGLLGWVVAPALAPDVAVDPIGAAVARVGALTVGLIWLCMLSLVIVYREEGDLRWATVRRRLRLNTPRDPHTGEPRQKLWLWAIPLVILIVLWELAVAPEVTHLWVSVFPFFAEPSGFALGGALASPEVRAQLAGAWGLLALFAVNAVFNTFLGEEFLFRGVLLPKMSAVFGRWDWLANGVLFGLYHLHQPWGMLRSISAGAFLYALPARRFRSTWLSVIVHSVQSVYFLVLILGLVLGLA